MDNPYQDFIDQFYRNNYTKSNFVPRVAKDRSNITSITEDMSSITIDRDPKNSQLFLEDSFVPYISYTPEGKTMFYRLIQVEDNVATYQISEPLGYPNLLVEYDSYRSNPESALEYNKVEEVIERPDEAKPIGDITEETQKEFENIRANASNITDEEAQNRLDNCK